MSSSFAFRLGASSRPAPAHTAYMAVLITATDVGLLQNKIWPHGMRFWTAYLLTCPSLIDRRELFGTRCYSACSDVVEPAGEDPYVQ